MSGIVNAVKHTVNEFEELYLDTLIAFYASLHYFNERKYKEAVQLSNNTLSQIENCLDFVQRSKSSLGKYEKTVTDEA